MLLHWTGSPYEWHGNDGAEASVILSDQVNIRYKEDSGRWRLE
jgi:hypothetical protein